MSENITTAIISAIAVVVAAAATIIVARINNSANRKKKEKKNDEEAMLTESGHSGEQTKKPPRIFCNTQMIDDMEYYFDGKGGEIWTTNNEGKPVAIPGKGEGKLILDERILTIERTNTIGRFEINLKKYFDNGIEKDFIERDVKKGGKMVLKISCQVCVIGGEHSLRFVCRGFNLNTEGSRNFLKDKFARNIRTTEWVTLNKTIELEPTETFTLRIDDMNVSSAPSSILIKNLVVMER